MNFRATILKEEMVWVCSLWFVVVICGDFVIMAEFFVSKAFGFK